MEKARFGNYISCRNVDIFVIEVITLAEARSKVTTRSQYDIVYLLKPPTNMPSNNFLDLIVLRYSPEKNIKGQDHYSKVK